MRAATAQNIKNMNMGLVLRHTAIYPLHPGIKFSPWKCVNSANTSLQNLYYEIFCYFRNGQNFHIFTHFYHFAILAKCSSGYRLKLLEIFLTNFKRYTGTFWKIRKALFPLKEQYCIYYIILYTLLEQKVAGTKSRDVAQCFEKFSEVSRGN